MESKKINNMKSKKITDIKFLFIAQYFVTSFIYRIDGPLNLAENVSMFKILFVFFAYDLFWILSIMKEED